MRTRSAPLTVRRAGMSIEVEEDRSSPRSQSLAPQDPREVSSRLEELQQAYMAASHYPRFRDLTRYRVRVSALILLMIVAQEALFALPTVIKRRCVIFRGLVTLGWAIVGGWLVLVYLR